VEQVIASERRAFVGVGGSGGVVVLDAQNGRTLRHFTPRSLGLSATADVTPLAYAHGALIVASFSRIMALQPDTGHIIWQRRGTGASTMTIGGDAGYTGEGCQSSCGAPASLAIRLTSGREIWRHPGNFGGPPELIAGKLYQSWGERSGITRVFDPASGSLLGTLPIYGQWTGDKRDSYVQTLAGAGSFLESVGPDGRPKWRLRLGRTVENTGPLLTNHRLYVPSNRFHPGLLAVSASKGSILWGADIGRVYDIAVTGRLLLASAANVPRVAVLNASSGHLLGQTALCPVAGPSNLLSAGGMLYAFSAAGINAFRL